MDGERESRQGLCRVTRLILACHQPQNINRACITASGSVPSLTDRHGGRLQIGRVPLHFRQDPRIPLANPNSCAKLDIRSMLSSAVSTLSASRLSYSSHPFSPTGVTWNLRSRSARDLGMTDRSDWVGAVDKAGVLFARPSFSPRRTSAPFPVS